MIDTATWVVMFGSTPVRLRRLEYVLLLHLAREPTRMFTKGRAIARRVGISVIRPNAD